MSMLRFKVAKEAFSRKAVPVNEPKERPSEYFGKYVFNREKMFKYLPKKTYEAVIEAIDNSTPLSREVADSVAAGMRKWALEMGATHYTHWFHPLTDGTAEKHDSFIEHDGKGGVVEEFSGKLLIQQEPDASSFPNGGIRNTFEARGYSAWDISSPAFILDKTLCIPTIFISYTGESLDYKTPLLKALNSVNKAAHLPKNIPVPNPNRNRRALHFYRNIHIRPLPLCLRYSMLLIAVFYNREIPPYRI